ncbi:ras guanine nucleotide exchange factor domain-containing protein [Choanephora cucurbitarum]|nr:ras guanine nucleotide exchange factor domain-containing protein [Choanephora cucurbitarum]
MPPTELQKRIHAIFSLWLSYYWNDFYGSHARRHIILFLDNISKYESLTPICDSLAPLVVREPPLEDPDRTWGYVDQPDLPLSPPLTPSSLFTPDPTLTRLLSLKKKVNHSESHPDLRSYQLPRRAEFAGGLINIDHVVHRHYLPSSTPSIATTYGWTSLGTSIMSSFRHARNEKDHSFKLLNKTSEHVIADQLTWIEAELFTRIKPREFVRHLWDQTHHQNTVMASIAHFNFISAWLVTMVVTQSRLSKRVALLQKFMLVAVELRHRNNYNSLMAILAGINSAAILRLKQTQRAIANKKVYPQFLSLERLMSTDRSFHNYRMALKASDAPGIPYLGIHHQDLVSLAEANKDFRPDGTVHWEKFRLMGETIMAMMKFKHPGYAIEPDVKLLTFIADCYILSEDEQYKRSTLVEPKLASTSTSRIRDLWFSL